MRTVRDLSIVAVLLFLGAAYEANVQANWILVRDPDDQKVCAAEDQRDGSIVGRWLPAQGQCFMSTFVWRHMLWLPDQRRSS